MRLASLLLMMIVVPASVSVAAQSVKSSASAPMVATAGNLAPLDDSRAVQSFHFTAPQPLAQNSPDDICYKIRAYIFKRDDDHAPELLRSTTCGPRQPHAKNAAWPPARLVPAK